MPVSAIASRGRDGLVAFTARDGLQCDLIQVRVIPGHTHLGVFMRSDAGHDVLPLLVEALDPPP